MTNLVTGLIGLLLVMAFLGIMLAWVPAIPLMVIVVVVMGLLVCDFIASLRNGSGGAAG
jgi:hypothetical protein